MRKINKYEAMFKENQISNESFERRKDSLEKWKTKNYQQLETKKDNYLMFYGNLDELLSMMKDKEPHNKPSSRKDQDKSYISDTELRFSDNISQSDFSNKHERRRSGNYLNTDFRNYAKEAQQYSFASTDDLQKAKEKLNLSKDSEGINHRYNKLEICKDYTKTVKGPIVAKDKNSLVPNEDVEVGRNSESLKPNLNLDDYVIDEPDKSPVVGLKDFLAQKVMESQNLGQPDTFEGAQFDSKDDDLHKVSRKESDDLVAFPSDDEASRKYKDMVIHDIESNKSESQHNDNSELSKPRIELNAPEEDQPAMNEDLAGSKGEKLKHESEEWPATFPNIEDKDESEDGVIQDEKELKITVALDESEKPHPFVPNSDLIQDVLVKEELKHYDIDPEDVAVTPKGDLDDTLNYDLKESNKSEIFEEPSVEPIDDDDILIASSQANIVTKIEDCKPSPTKNEDIVGFTEEEQKINKSFKTSDLHEEDEVPEKPTDLDVDGISGIEHISEYNESVIDKKIAEMIFEGIKEPTPSLKDIMSDDLTGNSGGVKKKSRTEDDLPGGSAAKSRQEKVDAISDEILFYLVLECRNNFFPQRVNPEKLKQKTVEEIERYEKSKRDQELASQNSAQNDEIKSAEELKEELENDTPDSKMAIKTDSITVKNYIAELFKKVDNSEEEFIMNLSSPLQRNPLEILMHLQNAQYELDSSEQLPYQPSVMSVEVYLDIERTRKKIEEQELIENQAVEKQLHDEKKLIDQPANEKVQNLKREKVKSEDDDDSSSSDDRSEFTREQELDRRVFNLKCEWENIHNKAVFDAVNEALDGLRPYGLKGPPLPWSKQNRTLTYKNGDVEQIPKILEQVEGKVMGWTQTYLGDDQVAQIREERLAFLLATEIEENEPIWTDYEFEETQVKLDLANVICEELIAETVDILKGKHKSSDANPSDNSHQD